MKYVFCLFAGCLCILFFLAIMLCNAVSEFCVFWIKVMVVPPFFVSISYSLCLCKMFS